MFLTYYNKVKNKNGLLKLVFEVKIQTDTKLGDNIPKIGLPSQYALFIITNDISS